MTDKPAEPSAPPPEIVPPNPAPPESITNPGGATQEGTTP